MGSEDVEASAFAVEHSQEQKSSKPSSMFYILFHPLPGSFLAAATELLHKEVRVVQSTLFLLLTLGTAKRS